MFGLIYSLLTRRSSSKVIYKFAFLLLLFLKNLASASCGTGVEQSAKNFFSFHRNFYYVNPSELKSLFTPDFFKTLENEYNCKSHGELCAIESDPWLGAQDGEIHEPVNYFVYNKSSTSAEVKINYTFHLSASQKENRVITLQFKKADQKVCWVLDDFITPADESLKANMRAWHMKYGNKK